MKLSHFYHVFAAGNWHTPVQEHVRALKEYSLYDALDFFGVGLVGNGTQCEEVKNFLTSQGLKFTIIAQAESGWEQVTQTPMWEYSQNNEGLIFYAHTKGASDPSDVNQRWRRSMIYWNVIKWKEAVKEFDGQVDAYGCHWIQPTLNMPEHKFGNFMFAGTFFWLRAEVMRRFQAPAYTHRHEAEGFCGYGWHAQPYNVYDPCPYFPNTGPFADGWIDTPNYTPTYHPPKWYPI